MSISGRPENEGIRLNTRKYTNRRYLDALAERVLVFDGAMGTNLQIQNLTAEQFGGERYAGCNDFLVISYPQAVEKVHRSFLEAGVDVLETDTFRSNRLTLAEYGLGERTLEINQRAAELARRLADEYSRSGQVRFVAGSMGPTGKLPSAGDPDLSNITYDELADIFREQAAGLLRRWCRSVGFETSQDILEVKAAIHGRNAGLRRDRYLRPHPGPGYAGYQRTNAAWYGHQRRSGNPRRTADRRDRHELLHRPGAHARTGSFPG